MVPGPVSQSLAPSPALYSLVPFIDLPSWINAQQVVGKVAKNLFYNPGTHNSIYALKQLCVNLTMLTVW